MDNFILIYYYKESDDEYSDDGFQKRGQIILNLNEVIFMCRSYNYRGFYDLLLTNGASFSIDENDFERVLDVIGRDCRFD